MLFHYFAGLKISSMVQAMRAKRSAQVKPQAAKQPAKQEKSSSKVQSFLT